ADDTRELGVEVDVGAVCQEIGRRREMGFVGPFLAREAAREQAFAEMLDLGVGREEAGSMFGHRSGPLGGPDRRTGPKLTWSGRSALVPLVAVVALVSDPIVAPPRRRAARTRQNWPRTGRRVSPPSRHSLPGWPRCCGD